MLIKVQPGSGEDARTDCAIQVSQDASIEQKMISSTVFSTLNEAWDKFKTDNGL